MAKRMTIWGIGPKLALLSFGFSTIPVFLTSRYPRYCMVSSIPSSILDMAGIILLAIGLPFRAASVRRIMRGFKRGELCTEGVYSVVRHPLYCALIFFIIPGILMFFRAWPLFTIPMAALIIFKRLICYEEEYLATQFGEDYARYKSRVHAILPVPRIW